MILSSILTMIFEVICWATILQAPGSPLVLNLQRSKDMSMTARPDRYCPIARTLDIVGERWTFLILRDLVLDGPRKFQDFEKSLSGISPNTLSARLKTLEDNGIVERRFYSDHPPRAEYVITAKGMGRETYSLTAPTFAAATSGRTTPAIRSFIDRLINEVFEQGTVVLRLDDRQLNHHDANQLFLRIDKKRRAGHADPEIFAGIAEPGVASLVVAHGKAQPKTLALRARRTRCAEEIGRRTETDIRRQMIHGHVPDGACLQQTRTVKPAAVEEHLAEPRIIGSRRDQADAAGEQFRGNAHVIIKSRRLAGGRLILRLRDARSLGLRHDERGVRQMQRLGNSFGNELIEWHAGYDLDNSAKHVGGDPVIPRGARLVR